MTLGKKKKLVIVDFQYDFCDKNGSLYVPGAEEALEAIIAAIKSGEYSHIIATLDWHRTDDKSFSVNGGQWPMHCVQQTEGAGINKRIVEAVFEMGQKMENVTLEYAFKGEQPDVEEYGAFGYRNGDSPKYVSVTNAASKVSTLLDKECKYDICGLAGDFCVWQTYRNMKKLGLDVTPLYDGIAFISEPFDYATRHE